MNRAMVVGAGVFGSWIAHTLCERGWQVTLFDQHGPANSRASSGGETRIIRSAYGGLGIYARWARESLDRWLALERRAGERLFVRTGALFVGRNRAWLEETERTLRREAIPCRWLTPETLVRRLPQLGFDDASGAVFEPEAGVLFARRAVQALVRCVVSDGVEYVAERADPLALAAERRADAIVAAAGPWLPQLLPDLREAILPTRQEVFFFGPPAGDRRFSPAHLPAWVSFDDGVYGLPDLEHRGVKIAVDAHGEAADPETMNRAVDADAVRRIRETLRRRVPALADAPLLESRVCQYENTSNGHLLIDRLPGSDRVWIAGGGSGHGFKHGPMVGRYVADLVEGVIQPEPMFLLANRPARARAVY
jgi:glycine/D-amino acid oxidase-like deaminating enzyme